jgi:hypothetical protein
MIACLAVVAVNLAAPTLLWRAFPCTRCDPWVSAALADIGFLAGWLVDLYTDRSEDG